MNCLNQEELIRMALDSQACERSDFRGAKGDKGQASLHLVTCATCQALLDDWRRLAARVAAAHQLFDEGHAAGRERLMATLVTESVLTSYSPVGKKRFSMKQRIALSSMAVAAALLLAAWLVVAGRPLSAMEQVAAAVRGASSFTLEVWNEEDGEQWPGGKLYWKAPGTVRLETTDAPNGNPLVRILPYHQPGIEIDEKHKTYFRLPAQEGYQSPIMALWKLGSFSGNADKDLAPRNVDDRPTRGFQIAVEKIDPNARGTLNIWVDAETNLPALVELEIGRPKGKMTMHNFHWNEPLDARLFDTAVPEGYADKTPKSPTVEETVKDITDALKFYSDVMGGYYPRVKIVYGDVTDADLKKKLGLSGKPPKPKNKQEWADYTKVVTVAAKGFGLINGILRDNADAAYYGKTVGPNDKDKVLLRWRLEDGNYRIVYGDLHSESVAADRLKALESR